MKKGDLLGNRYEIIVKIGEGGMGAVYKAHDKYLGDVIALKVLPHSLGSLGSDALERFKREAKAGMRITHENVIRIHDIGEHKGISYISMEFIEGINLKSIISEKGALPKEEALLITKQICKALQASHNKGIVHKDIKPPNILIESSSNIVKVVDFGLARSEDMMKVTSTGLLVGTPNYISPEQARGSDVDQRSDIYSLGVVMFEMFTGHLPFKSNSPLSVCNMHIHERPPTPESANSNVTSDISRIILKCLEKDPSLRYQDCGEILSDISRCLIMSEDKLNMGEFLGSRFEIVDVLGRGGMGVVYKAVDRNFNNMVVALKVLPDELVRDINATRINDSSSAVTSLIKEAATAARLNHPNIVRVFNTDEIAGKQYISMEFIEGQNFAQILHKKGTLSIKEVVNYGIQICEALGYAHANNVIHRDIKPSNFMLTKDDIVKVTDFGIAQIAESTTMVTSTATTGTLVYMSPQQLLGQKIDTRSDIYSLGILFYEFLTGKPPFISGDTTYQHINVLPKPPSNIAKGIPEEIDTIVMKCIQKVPDNRYQTCEEILVSLVNYADKSGKKDFMQISSSSTLTFPKQSQKQLFKYIGIGILALIAIITSISYTLRDHGDTESIPKLNMQAQGLFMERKYQEAKEKWNKILDLNPKHLQAISGIEQVTNKLKAERLHHEAKLLFRSGNVADDRKAIEKWSQALKLDQTHQDAGSYYQNALKIESHRDEVKRSIKRAQALFLDERYEDAKDEWEWVYSIDYRNLDAQKGLALIKQKLEIQQSIVLATGYLAEGLYQKAVNQWSKVLQLDPNNERALNNLKKAEKQLFIEQKDTKAYSAFKSKEYKKASEIWSSLLEENPSHPSKDKWIQFIAETERKIKTSNPVKIANIHMEAISFLVDKKYEEAISKWEEILVLNAQDELAQQKIKETRNKLELAKEIEVLITNSMNLRKEGKYEKAVQGLKFVLQMDPQNKQAQIHLKEVEGILDKQLQNASLLTDAKTLFNEKKYDEAIIKLEVALFIDPNNTQAKRGIEMSELALKVKRMTSRANRLFTARQYHDAIEVWQQILVIDKQNEYALDKIAEAKKILKKETLIKNAKLYFEEQEYHKAINEWNKILQLDPNNKNVQVEIKKTMALLEVKRLHESASESYENKKYQKALDTLNKILKIEPSNHLAGRRLQDIKNLQKDQMISKLLNQADKLDQEGEYDEAIIVLKSILNTDPINIDAKQTIKSIKTKQTNLKRQQQIIKRLSSKAIEFQKKGMYEEATDHWRQILELDLENQDALQNINTTTQKLNFITASLSKASDYFKHGDYQPAVEAWEVILKLDAKNIQAREGIQKAKAAEEKQQKMYLLHSEGLDLFNKGNYSKAISIWQSVLALDPDNQKAEKSIQDAKEANVLLMQKKHTLKSLHANAENALKAKNFEVAIFNWNKLLDLDPENHNAIQGIKQAEKNLERDQMIKSLHTRANNFFEKGRYHDAMKQWRSVINLNSSDKKAIEGILKVEKAQARLLNIQASELFNDGSIEKAMDLWKEVLELNPKDQKTEKNIQKARDRIIRLAHIQELNTKASTLLSQKRFQEAMNLWNQVIELDNKNQIALAGIESVQIQTTQLINELKDKAFQLYKDSKFVDAVKTWQDVLLLIPDDHTAKSYLIKAQDAFEKRRKSEENRVIIKQLLSKAEAYFKQKKYTIPPNGNAFQIYNEILKIDPENELAKSGIIRIVQEYKLRGDKAFMEENYSRAKGFYERLLLVQPENKDGKALLKMNEKFLIKQQHVDELNVQASQLFSSKGYNDAIDIWQRVKVLDPANSEADLGIKRARDKILRKSLSKASGLFKNGNYKDAVMTWKSILAGNPNNRDAAEGIKVSEQIKELKTHALSLFENSKYQEALAEWEKALEMNPRDSDALRGVENANTKIGVSPKILEEMKNGNSTYVIQWLNKGGSVNARSKDGLTLLMVAAWNGDTNMIQILLNKGADFNATSRDGETALMLSSLYGYTEVANSLLEKGADVNARNKKGDTALLWSALVGYTDTVKILLDKRANINAKNENGDTSLTVAARMGHYETVKTLLDKGVQVNAKNKNGNTALILAVEKGRTNTVQALLNSGVDVNAKNKNGDTALMVAIYKNNTKIVKMLKKAGAK